MSRQDVLSDVEATLGIVPGFMDSMPDMTLEHFWAFLKDFVMVDSALSAKTKALIGIGASATFRCDY
ncbi:MAG: hypothetical protein QGH15_21495 [Kiritimatiellia bacterium]|jgi:alkylhydroperoxidase/carboxymuconolactone decarboxylase family protein YurZ|nr:hypothetical protein [Kiritimatiellia bacterium]|tara:strand:- start:801 stop:1001 length:201 start_codon:yes stop_codon:yes gene_type:complete